jgi:hypothetical protein
LRVLHLFSSGLSKDTLVLSTSLFFSGPISQDLRSHRLGYHYGIAYVGLKLISLEAASITLRDSPLVNSSIAKSENISTRGIQLIHIRYPISIIVSL